jgi:hypothetical protein
MTPRFYCIYTTIGIWEVMALSSAQAIYTALELAGPGAKMLRIAVQGDW